MKMICLQAPHENHSQVGHLILKCKDSRFLTGPRLLRITEEVAIFLVGQRNDKAALALYVGKIIGRKVQNLWKAHQAITILSYSTPTVLCDGLVPDGGVERVLPLHALYLYSLSHPPKKAPDATAGVLYVASWLQVPHLYENTTTKYHTEGLLGGSFDAAACLRDFYGTPAACGLSTLVRAFSRSGQMDIFEWLKREDILLKVHILSFSQKRMYTVLNDAACFLLF
ncbi:hypothetical protein DUNSADRAFT_11210 [Dunaliella salina]|uniref:Uncharacterized protein n=1 Tax=Dunaliella salina TaxID=3046 RepID=A0ABQ7GDW9_DUNSA|nr:hypothetical protein DUNSADRAFT_11210 [Dunaliella salina]|eukprot:KAF5832801.1 hypothetical protein DUNSADRAFT_11210 [Dunaliella salina]